jgi:RNA polymerase sigma-70 factor (ECF subfamily)
MAEIDATDWRLSGGDRQAAFVRLVETHQGDLFRLAYVICGDREQAADVAQSAWQAAWDQLDDLRDPSAVRSWLLTITANQARRQLRRSRLRRLLEPRAAATINRHQADLNVDLDLAAALARLAPRDRQLVALRYLVGLTSEEIGPQVGLSASGVRVRLARVLRRLREELSDE